VSKKPDSKSGRVTFDERGQSVWEWRVDTDQYSSDVDTKTVRQIQEEVNVTLAEDAPVTAPKSFDPYSTVGGPSQPLKKKERRTLDDMRKLSEEIKRKRALEQKK
jgi:hypothetical protein